MWDGTRWATFDSTPPTLRPGAVQVNPFELYFAALADSMTFFWDRYVLTFGLGDQIDLFTDAFTWASDFAKSLRLRFSMEAREVFSRRTGWLLTGIVAIAFVVYLIQRGRRRAFDLLTSYLAAHGIQVGPAVTMEEALRELREQHPEAAEELEPLIRMYEEESFSGRADRTRTRELRRRLAELRT